MLRSLAVFFVIITHWGPNDFSSPVFTSIYQKIMPNGVFGVDLFFVLSGYLITQILLTARINAGGVNKLKIIKAFYIRRALRISPIYYLLIIIVILLKDQFVINHILYFITYTSNFLVFKTRSWVSITHTWSLSVEEQFYLIWPWVMIFPHKKSF